MNSLRVQVFKRAGLHGQEDVEIVCMRARNQKEGKMFLLSTRLDSSFNEQRSPHIKVSFLSGLILWNHVIPLRNSLHLFTSYLTEESP